MAYCTGDEPHTTPADCSDKPKLDCSDLADGYYPDEYNCRCLEHLLLDFLTGLVYFHIYGLFFHSGSTGIALGAKVNMFCVLQRTKAMERKIFSTMLRE